MGRRNIFQTEALWDRIVIGHRVSFSPYIYKESCIFLLGNTIHSLWSDDRYRISKQNRVDIRKRLLVYFTVVFCVNGASDLVCWNESGSPHPSLFYRFIMFLFYFRFTNKRLGIIAYIYIHCTTLTILKQNSNIFTIVYIHMYTNTLFNSFSMSYKLYKLKDACVAF